MWFYRKLKPGHISILLSLIILVVFSILSTSAQEMEKTKAGELRRKKAEEISPDAVITNLESIDSDKKTEVIEVIERHPDDQAIEEEKDNTDSERESPRQNRRQRTQPSERFPPEVRKIMEEEGISLQDLRDPEVRRKLRERVEHMRADQGEKPTGEEDSSREDGRENGKKGGSGEDKFSRYAKSIVEKNLFMALGSGREEKQANYALTAVISGPKDKAIIEEKGGGRSYYLFEGDTFGDDVEVVDISENVVKLDRAGNEEELKLGEGTGGGRRGNRGRPNESDRENQRPDRSERPSSPQNRRVDNNFDASQIPPFARRILEERGISIEDLRNDPELRERLRREFEERFRGGNRPQMRRTERRRR
jgi:hypothetical protein